MPATGVDTRKFKELIKKLEAVRDGMPDRIRKFHEELAQEAKEAVDQAIVERGVNDKNRTVRDAQEEHVGTKGGYAAVRPRPAKEGDATGADSVGAITNYLENGHRKVLWGKKTTGRVQAFGFYYWARPLIKARAILKAEKMAGEIKKEVEEGHA